jgi:hypothetical protein
MFIAQRMWSSSIDRLTLRASMKLLSDRCR